MIKKILRKYIPESILLGYHAVNAYVAALRYGFPGKHMTMIGITGTKGKTSTAQFVWSVLAQGGIKTGLIGTANIRIGDKEIPNAMHMTMPNPWIIQKLLNDIRLAGCTHVVMEVTSEGLKQYRNIGIDFRIAVFTNLSPEHLTSHNNSYEKYKQTKGKLFKPLATLKDSISIVNADDVEVSYFGGFEAGKKITYGIHEGDIIARSIREHEGSVLFTVSDEPYLMKVRGVFNIYNALPAIIIGHECGVPSKIIREGIASLAVIPGRMEQIDEGQNFTVIVDYAHEKLSMNTLLDTARGWAENNENIIVVVGAEGGGRDPAKREHIGRAAGVKATYVIVTTTDPYDDDPEMLAEAVAGFAEQSGKKRNQTLFVILGRREAITKALTLARPGDIVLLTGMGAQETMIMGGKALPWNERAIVRELIHKTLNKS
jgi:UDP-N-acetylmuramoyl-L-alanyl-D-glutamate--2,6-diaminopimelate ligase